MLLYKTQRCISDQYSHSFITHTHVTCQRCPIASIPRLVVNNEKNGNKKGGLFTVPTICHLFFLSQGIALILYNISTELTSVQHQHAASLARSACAISRLLSSLPWVLETALVSLVSTEALNCTYYKSYWKQCSIPPVMFPQRLHMRQPRNVLTQQWRVNKKKRRKAREKCSRTDS